MNKVFNINSLSQLIVVTGHYGVGKTNFALNLAHSFAKAGELVTLVDLDIVNPYFRSSDHREKLADVGIKLIAPTFAHTTVEAPSLPAEIYSAFQASGRVIIDVGGDDAGATSLGRYRDEFEARDYDLLYLVNKNRNLTGSVEEALGVLFEIERASGLKCSGVIHNTHLSRETTCEMIASAAPFAHEVAEKLGLKLLASTVSFELLESSACVSKLESLYPALYPIQILVLPPWE